MTLVNAVWKVNYGKAPDKGRAVAATFCLLAEAAFAVGSVGTPSAGVPYIQALTMEPAIRIERTTCGLRRPEPDDCSNAEPPLQSSEPDDTPRG